MTGGGGGGQQERSQGGGMPAGMYLLKYHGKI